MRSAMSRISFQRCEVKMMQVPRARSRRICANSQTTSRSTSEDVGSSSSSTSGSWLMARTISTICRAASERSSTSASGSMCSMPKPASTASASRLHRPRSIRPSRLRGSRAMNRFSATDIHGNSVSSWNTVQTPSRCASCGAASSTARPLMTIRPASGRSRPPSALISVLLPAPFSPTSACTSRTDADSAASTSACTPPKDLDTPLHLHDTRAARSRCIALQRSRRSECRRAAVRDGARSSCVVTARSFGQAVAGGQPQPPACPSTACR